MRIARWIDAVRAREWGVQLIILWLITAVYYGTAAVDLPRYVMQVARVTVWSAFILAGAYVFNDYCDRRADSVRTGSAHTPSLRPRATLLLAVASCSIGVALAFRLAGDSRVRFLVILQVLAGLAYSLPPVRLKERGWAGVAAPALFQRLPNFWMVALAFPVATRGALAVSVWLALTGLLFIVEHQLEDIDADRGSGVKTLAIDRGWAWTQRAVSIAYRLFVAVGAVAALALALDGGRSVAAGLGIAACSLLLAGLLRRRYASNRLRHPAVEPEDVRTAPRGAVPKAHL